MENNYYVYGYIRLDTNAYFYIGKGKRNRYLDIKRRNPHFKNIINTTDVVVEILYDNLTEEESFQLENEVIESLVFNEGYSIEIRDFCERNIGFHLVNQSFGGEGSSGYKLSDETKQKMSEQRKGENNYFYGRKHSDETKKKLSETRKEKELAKGKNNPMYGLKGDKSPIKGRKHSKEELNKMCLANPLRKEVLCIELNIIFSSLTKAENYMKEVYNIPFGRRALAKRLNGEINIDWYGEIEINGGLVKLHWKYI